MKRSILAMMAVVSIAVIPIACSRNKDPETPQAFTATTDTTAYPTQTATTTYPTAQPTDTTAATTTTPTATTTPATTGPVQPTVLDPAVQQVLRQTMQPVSQQHAKGMRAEGDMLTGVLQEGQSLEMTTMLQPGKCYTVVGVGLPMVQELDIQMLAVAPIPGLPGLAMAQDNTQGAQTAMAPAPNCYKYVLPLPAQVKIVVKATTGYGPVGAQLYSK